VTIHRSGRATCRPTFASEGAMTTTTMNRGAGASMAFMWTAAGISVSGSGGHPEPQRGRRRSGRLTGKGAPAGDLSSQRLPFVSEVSVRFAISAIVPARSTARSVRRRGWRSRSIRSPRG
jgi:hypothetical protein